MTTATTTQTAGMVGTLATVPELRFSQAGKPWMRARLSVKPYVPGATEQPECEFYDLVCFGSLAENVAETCRKGSRVVVSGRIEDASWTGNDGTEHPGQKIICDGIGLDLRFTGERTTPPAVKSSALADQLLGPAPAGSQMEPF